MKRKKSKRLRGHDDLLDALLEAHRGKTHGKVSEKERRRKERRQKKQGGYEDES